MSLFDRLGLGGPRTPVELVLYTRRGCHLCEAMKAEIERALVATVFTLREVDIDTDPELVRRHGLAIPVLSIDGRVAFKGRLTAGALLRKVARASAARGGA